MISEEDKIAHETLLKEIHLVDNLLETHANIMIVLISGMLFFLFKIESKTAMEILSIVGFFVSLEFFCHTYRFKHIAKSANDRLKEIEKRIGIDTTRKPTYLWKIKIPSGSTLLLCISTLFMTTWILLLALITTNMI